MQMGPRRTASAAHLGDFLTTFDQVALFHHHFGRMGVAANQIVAMVYLGNVAILGMIFLHHHDTTRSGIDRSTRFGRKI